MYKGEVKHLREMVAWLNCELEKTKVPSNAAEIALDEKLIAIIKTGAFIPAIKEYRVITDCSLKDAVDHCRALRIKILEGKCGYFDSKIVDPNDYIRREYMGIET